MMLRMAAMAFAVRVLFWGVRFSLGVLGLIRWPSGYDILKAVVRRHISEHHFLRILREEFLYLGHVLGLVLVSPLQEGGEGFEGLLFALLESQLSSDEAAEDAVSVFIPRDAQEVYPVGVLEALAAPGIIHALDYPVGLFQYLV